MPTLEDILNNDLGLGSDLHEKNASQAQPESDEIEKLAMEIGLVPDESSNSASYEETTGHKKEARMSLESLYSEVFPGDDEVVSTGSVKVASIDKEAAAIEEAIGEVAFDHYTRCLDGHITKIAEELAGGLNISAEKADGTPVQSMASNEDKDTGAIDTTPEVQDELMGTHPEGAVGKFEQKKAPNGEMRKSAMRKAYLQTLVDFEE